MAVSRMCNESGHNYWNSSFIIIYAIVYVLYILCIFSSFLLCCNASSFVICVIKNYLLTYHDIAMGQVPRFREQFLVFI